MNIDKLFQDEQNDNQKQLLELYQENEKTISYFKSVNDTVQKAIKNNTIDKVKSTTNNISKHIKALSSLKYEIYELDVKIPDSLQNDWHKNIYYITNEMSIGEVDTFFSKTITLKKQISDETERIKVSEEKKKKLEEIRRQQEQERIKKQKLAEECKRKKEEENRLKKIGEEKRKRQEETNKIKLEEQNRKQLEKERKAKFEKDRLKRIEDENRRKKKDEERIAKNKKYKPVYYGLGGVICFYGFAGIGGGIEQGKIIIFVVGVILIIIGFWLISKGRKL